MEARPMMRTCGFLGAAIAAASVWGCGGDQRCFVRVCKVSHTDVCGSDCQLRVSNDSPSGSVSCP
jgi:hypothetical protein